jgi:hypothetical protein
MRSQKGHLDEYMRSQKGHLDEHMRSQKDYLDERSKMVTCVTRDHMRGHAYQKSHLVYALYA